MKMLIIYSPSTERGLPPLPDATDAPAEGTSNPPSKADSASKERTGLSFSSKAYSQKRKAPGESEDSKRSGQESKPTKKKAKKAGKALLSFGDGDDV
jgi:hypothetical protein